MIKNILRYTLIGMIAVSFLSCEDEDAQRFPEFEKTVNVRFTFPDPDLTLFNFEELATAKIRYNIYSETLDNIDNISLQFTYTNAATGDVTELAEIKNYTSSDFIDGAILSQEITAEEMAAAIGVTLADLNGGDVFAFSNITTDADGKVYPDVTINGSSNVTPNIVNSSATSSFTTNFNALVGCPVAVPFTGTYLISDYVGPADGFNGDDFIVTPGEVTIESTGPIFRTFSFKYYSGANYDFDVDFNFTLLCGTLLIPATSSGLSCGGPSLGWAGVSGLVFDPNDDSELLVELDNNLVSTGFGGCGDAGAGTITFKLTKQ